MLIGGKAENAVPLNATIAPLEGRQAVYGILSSFIVFIALLICANIDTSINMSKMTGMPLPRASLMLIEICGQCDT